jgi:hypothetical protein
MNPTTRDWAETLRAAGRQRAEGARVRGEESTLADLLERAAEAAPPASTQRGDALAAASLAAGAVASGLAGLAPSPAASSLDAPLRAVLERAFESLPTAAPKPLQESVMESLTERQKTAPKGPSDHPSADESR